MALQQRRLRQILWAVLAAFGVAALASFSKGGYLSVGLELAAAALIVLAFRWNVQGQVFRASRLMLITLMVGLVALMAANEGLFDEAALALPAILVFAGMLGSRRLFTLLVACTQATLVLLFVLHQTNLLPHSPAAVDLQRLIMMSAILAAISFFVWLLSHDLHRTMAKLESEKQALTESHARIEVLAHRDTLTQLPNRTLAKDRLEQLLQARHGQGLVAVMFLDLDNFKTVNDSLGHAVGDELLCLVAERLGSRLRTSDTLARLAGDEFLILLGGMPHEEEIAVAARQVMEQLGHPFTLHGLDVVVTASLGIAVAPRDGQDVDALLKNADLAMYRAKDSGRNAFRFFDASMNENVVEHLHMASGLRTALAQEELQVHYQPQFDLRSGRIIGAEALLRWRHPQRGVLSPASFMPLAEESGMTILLGEWSLAAICSTLKCLQKEGVSGFSMAHNISFKEFSRPEFVAMLDQQITTSGVSPGCLEIEIAEDDLMRNPQYSVAALAEFKQLGVKLAIDDFGTGFSSLSYLQKFPVSHLEIDRSFIADLGMEGADAAITRTVITMGHNLDIEVVAKGVETSEQLDFLVRHDCDQIQGNYFSYPVYSSDLSRLLKTGAPLRL